MALDNLAVDFDGLADDMKHIQQSLTEMAAALLKATGVVILAYPGRMEAMMSLGKDWYNCAKQLTILIYASISIAKHCDGSLKVYLTDVLTPLLDENSSISAKEVILGRYIETLENDGTREQQLSQGFVDARLDLIEFSKNIQNVLSDSFIQSVLKERDQLISEITRMDEEIKDMHNQLFKPSGATSQGVEKDTAGEANDSGEKSDRINRIRSSVKDIADQMNKTSLDRQQKEIAGKQLQQVETVASFIRELLNTTLTEVQGAIPRAGNFATVWALLRHDTQQLWEILSAIKDDLDEPLFFLQTRVKNSMADYTKLATSLQRYIKALD